jgi:DNA-binding XRE family transcriptional regulator
LPDGRIQELFIAIDPTARYYTCTNGSSNILQAEIFFAVSLANLKLMLLRHCGGEDWRITRPLSQVELGIVLNYASGEAARRVGSVTEPAVSAPPAAPAPAPAMLPGWERERVEFLAQRRLWYACGAALALLMGTVVFAFFGWGAACLAALFGFLIGRRIPWMLAKPIIMRKAREEEEERHYLYRLQKANGLGLFERAHELRSELFAFRHGYKYNTPEFKSVYEFAINTDPRYEDEEEAYRKHYAHNKDWFFKREAGLAMVDGIVEAPAVCPAREAAVPSYGSEENSNGSSAAAPADDFCRRQAAIAFLPAQQQSGAQIALLRAELKVGQRGLARLIKETTGLQLTPQSLCRIEKGERSPSAQMLSAIALTLESLVRAAGGPSYLGNGQIRRILEEQYPGKKIFSSQVEEFRERMAALPKNGQLSASERAGAHMQLFRELLRLTRKEVVQKMRAKRVSLSTDFLFDVEKGKKRPSRTSLTAIVAVLEEALAAMSAEARFCPAGTISDILQAQYPDLALIAVLEPVLLTKELNGLGRGASDDRNALCAVVCRELDSNLHNIGKQAGLTKDRIRRVLVGERNFNADELARLVSFLCIAFAAYGPQVQEAISGAFSRCFSNAVEPFPGLFRTDGLQVAFSFSGKELARSEHFQSKQLHALFERCPRNPRIWLGGVRVAQAQKKDSQILFCSKDSRHNGICLVTLPRQYKDRPAAVLLGYDALLGQVYMEEYLVQGSNNPLLPALQGRLRRVEFRRLQPDLALKVVHQPLLVAVAGTFVNAPQEKDWQKILGYVRKLEQGTPLEIVLCHLEARPRSQPKGDVRDDWIAGIGADGVIYFPRHLVLKEWPISWLQRGSISIEVIYRRHPACDTYVPAEARVVHYASTKVTNRRFTILRSYLLRPLAGKRDWEAYPRQDIVSRYRDEIVFPQAKKLCEESAGLCSLAALIEVGMEAVKSFLLRLPAGITPEHTSHFINKKIILTPL